MPNPGRDWILCRNDHAEFHTCWCNKKALETRCHELFLKGHIADSDSTQNLRVSSPQQIAQALCFFRC
jgi:hypothetical protein